ncbi:N-acetylglucosamine-6-phosphate deacetylase [Thermoanaerobacterium thermosaccharolyticum]|uniref:N-acetylglucosamine-6-phosphate deacetylase n=1 Tax=Thermoanaerobacterium thermosaccharolyticum TaxID=1517 RepID=UPI0017834DA4|nr:N-acetylglucosamine-6-phosphate deacetylase [Thermoanaerobacterium thermosaccharolyticum]MBE0068170.1 N-acetylglucosamine-6-phosphate deacetylase [Thermoanaerobacterium thermosaccharolyticum]MBE0227945.1 N-acetylglucosamine-6-phosphate deacetylase [Thermoanaerobacterium thermosaccharolyticum]
MSTLIINGRLLLDNNIVDDKDLLIEDNKIAAIGKGLSGDNVIDADGNYVSPGFIDIHIHGSAGFDTMDGTFDAINAISKSIAKRGTTSFLPTTMTEDKNKIKNAIKNVYENKNRVEGAEILGIHMEGPFINPKQKGAQDEKFILKPTIDNFFELGGDYIDIVKLVTIAPEIDGSLELIKFLKEKGIIVSVGHTDSTYDEVVAGFKAGMTHATHVFNAMRGFHHREVGTLGAIFDLDISAELIADGIHSVFPAIRTLLKLKGKDNTNLITDAMMAANLSDGVYQLGGQDVYVKNGAARLKSGVLAGSTLTLDKAVKNILTNTDLSLYESVALASYNSAKVIGVQDRKGLIKEGYDADIIIFDDDIDIKKTIVGGKIVYEKK